MKGNSCPQGRNRLVALGVWILFSVASLCAQDSIPVLSRPLEPLRMPGETREMHRAMQLIVVHDSLPEGFANTADNLIDDPKHSLLPFWKKLNEMEGPVRIVHIGDSHVRGHLYPLVTRRKLEHDFGDGAVKPGEVSYRTSGLVQETGSPGVVYHMLGVNGATGVTFTTAEKVAEVAALKPDLVIISFGTNEAHSRRYLPQAHDLQLGRLMAMLREACPQSAFLLTTPPGAYTGRRRSRVVNPRTVSAARVIKEHAHKHNMAVWDMYNIVGGKTSACRNWTKHRMFRPDGIHFTPDGYRLQGNLLHQALIKAYNEYVATGLE